MQRRYAYAINPFRILKYSPFGNAAAMEALNIEYTDDVTKAELVFAAGVREVAPEHVAPGRTIVTCTGEPKWDHNDKWLIRNHLGGGDAYIFNVYNWNFYFDNFRYGPSQQPVPLKTRENVDRAVFERSKIAVFAGYRKYPVVIRGKNVALDEFRGQFALDLHKLGRCDIQGNRWPEGIAIGNTRNEQTWGAVKIDALRAYAFNFCSENTDFDNYVTEKFWHAIAGGTLPIYLPPQSFYWVSPEDSFLDLREPYGQSAETLIDYIDRMSLDEYIERYNRCAELYNRCVRRGWLKASVRRTIDVISSHLRAL